MDNQKFQIILDSLLERSQKDELNWKSTAGSGKYLLTLNDSSITIQKLSATVVFEFRNEKGETVEGLAVNPLDEKSEKAKQLEDLARRKALRSDETIDRIIEQLNPDSIAA